MREFPPSIDPHIYTLSALIVGYALIGDFSANEQRAIGNWLIGAGQVLITNSSFQIMIEDRMTGPFININSKQFKCGGSPFTKGDTAWEYMSQEQLKKFRESITETDLNFIYNAMNKIVAELEKLKKGL